MDNNIAAVRLALTVVLSVTLICLELDLACSLENKVGPADILSKQEALQNAPTFVTPLAVNASDSIAYVFSDMGDYILDNNSVLGYNGSEILGTVLARHGNFTDSEASTNITAAYLSKYLAGNVPLNRNLYVIYDNGKTLSYYQLANYSFEERLLLIYLLFDYLSKKEDNKNSRLLISILINASNSSTLNGTQSGWQSMLYFINNVNESSKDPAILLSAFCEKLGIDARIIAGYGVTSKVENISSNLSSDNLHLYAEAYLGTHNSQERNDVLVAVDQIKKRYNVSDVYSHINLSTNDVWLNLDVASPYPGGPFNASPKQMQVYISSLDNQSNKSINETSIKANETPSNVVDFVPSIVNENVTASLDVFNSTDLVGYKNLKDFIEPETKLNKNYMIRPSSSIESFQKSMYSANYGETLDGQIESIVRDDFSKRANIIDEVDISPSKLNIGNKLEISRSIPSNPPESDSKVTEDTNVPSKSNSPKPPESKSMIPSHHSENDNDDRYKIAYEMAGNEHPVEAATEAEAATEEKTTENATAAEAMGGGKDSNVIIYYILKLMGLIAGGFIVIIATGYRGREPPMDDDDFDDIVSFKRNIDNKRSGK